MNGGYREPLTDELKQEIYQYVMSGHSYRQARDKFGKSVGMVAKIVKGGNPEFPDLKTTSVDWREVFDHCDDTKKLNSKASNSQIAATIPIKTGRPFAITFSADWHLGSMAVDHKELRSHIEKILSTDDLFMFTCGDEIDNFLHFRSIMPILSQSIPPKLQVKVLKQIFDELLEAHKLKCTCWGNHTSERTEKDGGFDVMEQLAENRVPYFGGKGIATIDTGKIKYEILLTHKSRYSSFLNKLHGNKREFQLYWPAQVVVTAHTHNPDFETYNHYRNQNFLVKPGTFKTDDTYSSRYWESGILGTPTLVFYPDHNEIVPFLTVDQAVKFMKVA